MFATVWNNPDWLVLTAKTDPSADASNRAWPSPAILKKNHFDRERNNLISRTVNEKMQRDNTRLFRRNNSSRIIITLLTCILTLAVSNGKVAKSAMQAAVPAVSNFTPSEKSSDIPCFIISAVRSLFQDLFPSYYCWCVLLKVSVDASWRMMQDSWINWLIFSSVTVISPLNSLVSFQRDFFLLGKWSYVHYIQSPTKGQELSDVHGFNWCVLKGTFP